MAGHETNGGQTIPGVEAVEDREWVVNQVAHALRNPIFAAMMLCDVLTRRYTEPETVNKCAGSLRAQLDRLENTIDEMLLYGRPCRINPSAVSVEHLLHDLVDTFRQGLRRNPADVRIITPDHELRDISVQWDGNIVRKVLERLLDNVVDHTPAPHRTDVGVAVDGETVSITITDDGPGLADQIMATAKLPFSPQHRGRPGLGLAVADKLARAAGGVLRLTPAPGRGVKVSVELPVIMDSHGA